MYTLFDADLARYVEHRPSILYWIVTSGALFGEIGMGLLRAIKPWHQWILGWRYDLAKGMRICLLHPSAPRSASWWATPL